MVKIFFKIKEHYREGGLKTIFYLVGRRIYYIFYEQFKIKRNFKKQRRRETREKRRMEDEARPIYERGQWVAYKKIRKVYRLLGKIINCISIRKNKETKILVVLHFFYINSIEAVVEYLKNMDCYNYDLIVTYPEMVPIEKAKNAIRAIKTDARFMRTENKGYDIGAFLEALDRVKLDKYDIVIKLQTKSTNKSIYVYDQFFRDDDWFENLWNGVIGCLSVHRTIRKLMQKNAKNGLVAARNLIIQDPVHKRKLVKETLLRYKKIDYREDYRFVAGSCFAIRAKCLEPIKKLKLKVKDFEETRYGFFSLAHVIERAICFVGMDGYQYVGNRVNILRRLRWRKLEKRLYAMSGVRIAELPQFDFSPDFVWHVLEQRFLEKYTVVKIPVGKIRREYFDGSIIRLEDCEPYKYLEGDKEIYERYSRYQEKNGLPHMNVLRFERLLKNITENGYDSRYPIVVGHGNKVWDGQHRACILLKLYGRKYKITAIKCYPVSVVFDEVEPFTDKITIVPEKW